jgi:hypothetical protein
MKRVYALTFFVCQLSLQAHEDPSEEEIYITIVNDAQQSADLKNKDTGCLPCQQLFGAHLKECMRYLSDEQFKQQFFALHHRARALYFLTLNRFEHAELIHRFADEHEWQEHRARLSNKEKKYLPKTLKEQQEIIDDAQHINYWWTYYECIACAPATKKTQKECVDEAIEHRYVSAKQQLIARYTEIIE